MEFLFTCIVWLFVSILVMLSVLVISLFLSSFEIKRRDILVKMLVYSMFIEFILMVVALLL